MAIEFICNISLIYPYFNDNIILMAQINFYKEEIDLCK